MTLRSTSLIFLILLIAGSSAMAGRISVGREIRYPTEFDIEPAQTRGTAEGSVVVTPPVVTPRRFETRRVGAGMDAPRLVSVSRQIILGRERVRVRFDDGFTAEFVTGETTVVRGHLFRGMGWRNRDYVVRNMGSGQLYVFGPLTE